jgi:hypothetical protein
MGIMVGEEKNVVDEDKLAWQNTIHKCLLRRLPLIGVHLKQM